MYNVLNMKHIVCGKYMLVLINIIIIISVTYLGEIMYLPCYTTDSSALNVKSSKFSCNSLGKN